MINEDDLAYCEDVQLIWGEPDGGSNNPAVERHTQTTIRATMGPRPFAGETKR